MLGSLPASLALPSWSPPHYLAGHVGGVLDFAVDHHPGKNALLKTCPTHPSCQKHNESLPTPSRTCHQRSAHSPLRKKLRKWYFDDDNFKSQQEKGSLEKTQLRPSLQQDTHGVAPLPRLKTFLNLWIGFPFIRTVTPWATPLIMSPWIPQLHEAHPLNFFCLKKWIPVQDTNQQVNKNRISKASAKGQALINERSCALKKHVGQTLEHVLPTCLSARGPHACSGMMPERRSSQVLFICEAMRKLDLSYPESNFQTAVAATQSH